MNTEFRQWLFDLIIDCVIASGAAIAGLVTVADSVDIFKKPMVWIALLTANATVIKTARRSLPKRLEARVEAAAIIKADEKVQTMIGNLPIPPDPRL